MQRSLCPALAMVLSTFGLVASEDFAPIPPAVWAIKEGPKGAVVLEDRMRFNVTSIDYIYRVRVFAEAGREAAEIQDLPSSAYNVKGHTVYPDGREVTFSSRKDFAERRIESATADRKTLHLVAPGITHDCVMEVSWTESANGLFRGLPDRFQRGLYSSWTLANPYPTQIMAVEVRRTFPLAWSLTPGRGPAPETSEASGYKRIVLRDVPALDPPPYSLRSTLQLPRMVMFWQPEELGWYVKDGGDAYWKQAVTRYFRPEYEEGIDKGGTFKSLAQVLIQGLPASPTQAATELLARLEVQIANLSHATHAEVASLPKGFWDGFNPKDLAEAAKTRKTNSHGMRLLYFHLLRAAGLKPMIAKVPNRDQSIFDWNHLNPWQFATDLIGIQEPGGGVIWFDPELRFATPGVVLSEFTGVPALILDSQTWQVSKGSVGGLPASAHTRRYAYTLDLRDDGDAFEVQSEFRGIPEYAERNRFMVLEPKEQSKLLKEQFEAALKSLVVTSAEVKNTADAKASVTWQLKGTLERESGRKRVVDPFPGMPWPLTVPSKMEPTRSTTIIVPYPLTQLAVATFKVPDGYTMGAHQDLRQQNGFGRVFWVPSFDAATGTGKVVLRVEVTAMSAPASEWEAFKTFLGWIEDACRRQVVLTKER